MNINGIRMNIRSLLATARMARQTWHDESLPTAVRLESAYTVDRATDRIAELFPLRNN